MSPGIKPCPFRTPHGVALAFTNIGFGTAPLGSLYRPLTEQDARTTGRPNCDDFLYAAVCLKGHQSEHADRDPL